jgi:hypothetical protein
MKRHRFYMHKNSMDICLEILKSHQYNINPDRYSIRGMWWNLGYTGNPWVCHLGHRFEIHNASEWIDVTHTMHNIRTKPGPP